MREKTERWMELCKLVAEEQDPARMIELVTELNKLLEAKERRLGMKEIPLSKEPHSIS